MSHALVLVKAGIGRRNTLPADIKSPVGKLKNIRIFAGKPSADLGLLKDDTMSGVSKGQLRANISLVTQAQNIAQPVWFKIKRPVQIVTIQWYFGKLRVETFHEFWKECIYSLNVRYFCLPQRFNQPILQRPVGSLDPALGLRAVGTKNLDILSSFMARPNWVIL